MRFVATAVVGGLLFGLTAFQAKAGPQPRSAFAREMLALHNGERAAKGAPPLVWDEGLALEASGYARRLASQRVGFDHSPLSERREQGENLWMGTAGHYSVPRMFDAWAREKRHFQPGVFPKISRTVHWSEVGHYTQIIWRDTERVGCGIQQGAGRDYLVCRYWPGGNVRGRFIA